MSSYRFRDHLYTSPFKGSRTNLVRNWLSSPKRYYLQALSGVRLGYTTTERDAGRARSRARATKNGGFQPNSVVKVDTIALHLRPLTPPRWRRSPLCLIVTIWSVRLLTPRRVKVRVSRSVAGGGSKDSLLMISIASLAARFALFASVVACVAWPTTATAQSDSSRTKTILVLHTYGNQSMFRPMFDRALQQALNQRGMRRRGSVRGNAGIEPFPWKQAIQCSFKHYLGAEVREPENRRRDRRVGSRAQLCAGEPRRSIPRCSHRIASSPGHGHLRARTRCAQVTAGDKVPRHRYTRAEAAPQDTQGSVVDRRIAPEQRRRPTGVCTATGASCTTSQR